MILLDSSFLCAWHNERDVHHAEAKHAMRRFLAGDWGAGLLLEYVFVEVITVLLARRGKEIAVRASEILLSSREIRFLPCSDLFVEALQTFRDQAGRELSFTDAALVAVSRRLDEPRIASFDRGFRDIEGLEVLPAPGELHEA
jgi:predicted nucleic acid-binding protein